jgi:hypothetical protein
MLLLDTADLPVQDRVEALRADLDQTSVPGRIEHLGPDGAARARRWTFGPATLLTIDSTGFRLVRSPNHVHRQNPTVMVKARLIGRLSQAGADQPSIAGELTVSDLTAPYVFSWTGGGGSWAFQVPFDQLGLSADVVRAAGPRLRVSPLYEPVRDHLVRLVGLADVMAADPGVAALGTATTELVRALLLSAAGRSAPEIGEHPWRRGYWPTPGSTSPIQG